MNGLSRAALILLALQTTISGVVGVAPVGTGYRLDLAAGGSRTATQAEIDAATAWADARIAERTADGNDTAAVKADAAVRNLMLMTPAQIETWASNNIGNLAQARAAIILLAKALSIIARATLR